MIAADGTSIIAAELDARTASPDPAEQPPAMASSRRRPIELLAGRDHRQHDPELRSPAAASSSARSWSSSRAGCRSRAAARGHRAPGSPRPAVCHAAGLSPPTSSVRNTIGRPGMAATDAAIGRRCSADRRGGVTAEEQELGADQPDALGSREAEAASASSGDGDRSPNDRRSATTFEGRRHGRRPDGRDRTILRRASTSGATSTSPADPSTTPSAPGDAGRRSPSPGRARAGSRARAPRSRRGRSARRRRGRCPPRARAEASRPPRGRDRRATRTAAPVAVPQVRAGDSPRRMAATRRPTSRTSAARSRKMSSSTAARPSACSRSTAGSLVGARAHRDQREGRADDAGVAGEQRLRLEDRADLLADPSRRLRPAPRARSPRRRGRPAEALPRRPDVGAGTGPAPR